MEVTPMKKVLLAMLILLILGVSAAAETRMCAVNVGKGDAIIITVDDSAYLIDAAKGYACGRLRRALSEMGITRLDGVFVTHVDSDHTEGLGWLAESGVAVENWYASPYFFEYKEGKHPLEKLGLDVTWLQAGDSVAVSGGAFRVLAPLSKNTDEENDNSLVMMLETGDGRILLTGDMEKVEEAELMATNPDLACHVLKVANHGDNDASGSEFLAAAAPYAAVISTDSLEEPDTPAPEVLFELARLNADTYVTQDHSAVLVTLDGGDVSAEYLDWESSPNYDVTMTVDAENELFTISNAGNSEVPLTDWYIYSEKGNELFAFASGLLPAGGSVTVGTRSSPEGAYDILWDEKNVVSDKKADPLTLYDPDGNAISYTGA
jgi:competence protein ComEC